MEVKTSEDLLIYYRNYINEVLFKNKPFTEKLLKSILPDEKLDFHKNFLTVMKDMSTDDTYIVNLFDIINIEVTEETVSEVLKNFILKLYNLLGEIHIEPRPSFSTAFFKMFFFGSKKRTAVTTTVTAGALLFASILSWGAKEQAVIDISKNCH